MSISRRSFLQRTSAGAAAFMASLHTAQAATQERMAHVFENAPHAAFSRDAYMLGEDVRYFNHGSIGTVPRVVHEAHTSYLDLCETNPWLYMWSTPWQESREQVRTALSASLGCSAQELVFTHNTTEGFNLLAQGLPLGPGDEVVFSNLNHSGASVCWEHHGARRGYNVRRFDVPLHDIATFSEDDVVALHLDALSEATKVLVLPHIDNIVGLRHPLRAIADAARARGVHWVAVDGAQAAGMVPFRLDALGVDFYANSPHKWLQAPKGTGLLYVNAKNADQLEPMWVTWGQRSWAGSVRVLEDYGTRNLPAVIALGDALAFQQQANRNSAAVDHRHALWKTIQEHVDVTQGLTWKSPRMWALNGSLYAIEVHRDSRAVFTDLFQQHGYVFRAFHSNDWNTIWLSPNTMNSLAEANMLVQHLAA